MNIKLIPIGIIILITISCEDLTEPTPMLPPYTTEGKNTLGFNLDGKLWLPYIPFPNLTGDIYLSCGIKATNNYLVLHTERNISIYDPKTGIARDSVKNTFVFSVANVTATGSYKFYSWKDIFIDATGECFLKLKHFYYDLDTTYSSEFKVVYFDPIAKIISGTFLLNMVNPSCGDTLEVRDGRFDINFHYVQ